MSLMLNKLDQKLHDKIHASMLKKNPRTLLSNPRLRVLDKLKDDYDIDGKKIVVILSGGNNDISRYNEIMQLNLEYMGLIHYFVIEFNQNPGQLKFFINNILTFINIRMINFFKFPIFIYFVIENPFIHITLAIKITDTVTGSNNHIRRNKKT